MIAPPKEIIREHSPQQMTDRAASWLLDAIVNAVRMRGHCCLALAGGSTPRSVYERLASPPLSSVLPASKLQVYFGDERCVPPNDPQSNYAMAWDAWLGHGALRADQIHRIEGEREDRNSAAQDYERTLPAHLDILLLGVGNDGHTASLFPGAEALREHSRKVVVSRSPLAPHDRITITPPVIEAAHAVMVLAVGSDKAAAVAAALAGPEDLDKVPAQLARPGTWILDTGAASLLPV